MRSLRIVMLSHQAIMCPRNFRDKDSPVELKLVMELGPAFRKPPISQKENKQILKIEVLLSEECLINVEKYLKEECNKDIIIRNKTY